LSAAARSEAMRGGQPRIIPGTHLGLFKDKRALDIARGLEIIEVEVEEAEDVTKKEEEEYDDDDVDVSEWDMVD